MFEAKRSRVYVKASDDENLMDEVITTLDLNFTFTNLGSAITMRQADWEQ